MHQRLHRLLIHLPAKYNSLSTVVPLTVDIPLWLTITVCSDVFILTTVFDSDSKIGMDVYVFEDIFEAKASAFRGQYDE